MFLDHAPAAFTIRFVLMMPFAVSMPVIFLTPLEWSIKIFDTGQFSTICGKKRL